MNAKWSTLASSTKTHPKKVGFAVTSPPPGASPTITGSAMKK